VARVDASNSTAIAVEKYCELLAKLSAFYLRRPDIKAKVDPELVIFDLSDAGLNLPIYIAQRSDWHSVCCANHFISWMMGTVPALRVTLQPAAPGGVLIY
jgi:hypothetical protein